MADEKYTVEYVDAESMPPREGRSGLQVHALAQTELASLANQAFAYAEHLQKMPGEFAAGAQFAYYTMRREAKRSIDALNLDWVTGQAVSERNRLQTKLRDAKNELEHREETIWQLEKRNHELSEAARSSPRVQLARMWISFWESPPPDGRHEERRRWLDETASYLLENGYGSGDAYRLESASEIRKIAGLPDDD